MPIKENNARPAETTATRFLSEHNIIYSSHYYDYKDHGGTHVPSEKLNVSEHCVIKTLIMEDEKNAPLIMLMHGDRHVSTKSLAKQIGKKKIEPCKTEIAEKYSGYKVGGISPFGTRKAMPVYIEKTILDLPLIYINGGKRGYLLSLNPQLLMDILKPILVNAAR